MYLGPKNVVWKNCQISYTHMHVDEKLSQNHFDHRPSFDGKTPSSHSLACDTVRDIPEVLHIFITN